MKSLERCAGRLQIVIEVGTCGIEPDHLLRYLALARRFGQSVVFDLSDTASPGPDAVLTVRAATAVDAVRAWNALMAR